MSIFGEISLVWMPQVTTLLQVTAWCRQATSHYLSQCRPDLCHLMASVGHKVLILWLVIAFFSGLVGLAISYALSITNLMSGVVTSFTETEKQMVSVERVEHYIHNIPKEVNNSILSVSSSCLVLIKSLTPGYSKDTVVPLQYKDYLSGYRHTHHKDKMFMWLSYLYSGNSG